MAVASSSKAMSNPIVPEEVHAERARAEAHRMRIT